MNIWTMRGLKTSVITVGAMILIATSIGCDDGGDGDLSGTPVNCDTESECPEGFVCASLQNNWGHDPPTEKICVEPVDCGDLTCDSGLCANEPGLDPTEPRCIAE